jgi:hypothetical protein
MLLKYQIKNSPGLLTLDFELVSRFLKRKSQKFKSLALLCYYLACYLNTRRA